MRLVRNFLLVGTNGTLDTWARVSWITIILPCSEGGLGIIDLDMPNRALLGKLLLKG